MTQPVVPRNSKTLSLLYLAAGAVGAEHLREIRPERHQRREQTPAIRDAGPFNRRLHFLGRQDRAQHRSALIDQFAACEMNFVSQPSPATMTTDKASLLDGV
jgi:hypothetical protein